MKKVHSDHPHLSGTNLQRAGDYNYRVTLQAIRVTGPITRVELAAITGLTPPTIANITKRLLVEGLIREAGQRRGGRGQPATKIEIDPDGLFSIGLNVDRDHITMVILDFAGKVRARASREIAFALPGDVDKFFSGRVRKLLDQLGIGTSKLSGIGVASPDDMPHAATLPHQPTNYNVWATTDIPKLLQKTLPVPVFVENDAAAATIGEMRFGLGQQHQTFFYILITAALGGSLVFEGHHFRGASGRSGELGLLEGKDPSGRDRQIQEIVSLSALYGRLAAQGIVVETPHELTRLNERGRAVMDAWTEDAVDTLMAPLVAITCLFNPQAVLIGGRLPASVVDNLATRLNQKLHAYANRIPVIAPISRAALSDDAPAVGAAILPFSDRLLPSRSNLMKVIAP